MKRFPLSCIVIFLLCILSQPILAQYTIWHSPLTFSTDQTQLTIKQDLNLVDFRLKQNYLNPFYPSTTIDYEVQKTTNVRIDIFNSIGQARANISEWG